MRTPKPPRFVRFTVSFRERDLGGVLDMMRYEQSTVLTWDHGSDLGPDSWSVTLRCERPYFQPDRWSSFLLRVRDVQESDY